MPWLRAASQSNERSDIISQTKRQVKPERTSPCPISQLNCVYYWIIPHFYKSICIRMSRSNSTSAIEEKCRTCIRSSSKRRHSTRNRNAKHAHHDSQSEFCTSKSPVHEECQQVPKWRQIVEQEEQPEDHHRRRRRRRLRKRIVDGAKLSAKLMAATLAAIVFCAAAPILYVVIPPPAHDADDRA